MITRTDLESVATCELSASTQQIADAELAFGHVFPLEYKGLLLVSNGCSATGSASLTLYSCADLVDRNDTFEVRAFMKTYIMIGDDGGGRGIFIELSQQDTPLSQVYILGTGAIGIDKPTQVSRSLGHWIQDGFLLPD